MIRILFGLTVACVMMMAQTLSAAPLNSYKDRQFQYPKVLEDGYGGDYLKLDYRSERDIDQRDEIRGARVKGYYVTMRPRRSEELLSLRSAAGTLEYGRVGKPRDAKWIVVFLHGRNGDRKLGLNDWSFGGNFNRLKNLAVRNSGLYLTPSLSDFGPDDTARINALTQHYLSQAPGAKVLLACGSMGGQICWRFLTGSATGLKIDGAFMLGAFAENGFLASSAATGRGAPIPIVFAHGTDDTAFAVDRTRDLFVSLKVSQPDYPARLLLFNSGSHGTPIRMIDWRREINWMLTR